MKWLIIQTAFIGDVILGTALPESISEVFPEAEVDFLVRKGHEHLLLGHPHIRRVWVWDKRRLKYFNLWRLRSSLRAERYDVVVNLQRFAATGFLSLSIGAGRVVGFSQNPFSRFFTHRVEHRMDVGFHEIERNHALLSLCGEFPLKRPRLYPSERDFQRVRSLVGLRSYCCMAPASIWFTKQWPEASWVALSESISGCELLFLLGSAADRAKCERIRQESRHPGVINLAGRLSLLESAALMAGAKMNYVNDSAPLHLCSAMNAPVTAIFCSTVPAFGFGPLSERSFVVETERQLSCRPCGLHGKRACPQGHFHCVPPVSAVAAARAVKLPDFTLW